MSAWNMPSETQRLSVSTATIAPYSVQHRTLIAAAIGAASLFAILLGLDSRQAVLFLIGIGLGIALYHAALGFTGAYCRAILERGISGVTGQKDRVTDLTGVES